jgi:hypothetical protein
MTDGAELRDAPGGPQLSGAPREIRGCFQFFFPASSVTTEFPNSGTHHNFPQKTLAIGTRSL